MYLFLLLFSIVLQVLICKIRYKPGMQVHLLFFKRKKVRKDNSLLSSQ